jgi:hypothetical protein
MLLREVESSQVQFGGKGVKLGVGSNMLEELQSPTNASLGAEVAILDSEELGEGQKQLGHATLSAGSQRSPWLLHLTVVTNLEPVM